MEVLEYRVRKSKKYEVISAEITALCSAEVTAATPLPACAASWGMQTWELL